MRARRVPGVLAAAVLGVWIGCLHFSYAFEQPPSGVTEAKGPVVRFPEFEVCGEWEAYGELSADAKGRWVLKSDPGTESEYSLVIKSTADAKDRAASGLMVKALVQTPRGCKFGCTLLSIGKIQPLNPIDDRVLSRRESIERGFRQIPCL